MFTELFIVKKLLITAFIIGHHDVYGYNSRDEAFMQLYKNFTKKINFTKHPSCFVPFTPECKKSVKRPLPGYEVTRWTYDPPAKVCVPVFMLRNETCKDLDRLPLTLDECQDLCGEPCLIVRVNNKLIPGICAMKCRMYLLTRIGIPKPCPFSAKCCNRYYKYSTFSP